MFEKARKKLSPRGEGVPRLESLRDRLPDRLAERLGGDPAQVAEPDPVGSPAPSSPAELAAAHGFVLGAEALRLVREVPGGSQLFHQQMDSHLLANRSPCLALANTGSYVQLGTEPSRTGVIALHLDLATPTLLLRRTGGPLNVLGAAFSALDVLSAFDGGGGDGGSGPSSREYREIGRERTMSYRAYGERKRFGEVERLLTPEVLELWQEPGHSFSLRVADGWMQARNLYGDVVSDDPAVWPWVNSVVSRMVDIAGRWGCEVDWALHTPQDVPRPQHLDSYWFKPKKAGPSS